MDGSGKETETGVMRSPSCMVLGLVWEGVRVSAEGGGRGGGMMHVAESAGQAWENEKKKWVHPARLPELPRNPTLAWLWGGFDRMTKTERDAENPRALACPPNKTDQNRTDFFPGWLVHWAARQATAVRLMSEAAVWSSRTV